MSLDPENLRARLAGLGFDVVRFVAVDGEAAGGEVFRDWLAKGNHADMRWLEKTPERRTDPRNVLVGAKSLIMLGVNYGAGEESPGGPIWARYALNQDYHDTLKPGLVAAGKVLEAELALTSTDYRYYVDTGPLLERNWATAAGLGFTGKNAMLISRDFGNWLFLAGILVATEIPSDRPVSRNVASAPVGSLCGSCTACLDACPTNALTAPGVLDARRCISYQTIENKGIIPRELRTAIGSRIYGCDICAEVCPWNRFAQEAKSGLIEARPHIAALGLKEVLQLTPESFAAVFKGTPIKRLKLRGLLRNACLVAANEGKYELVPELEILASEHTEALVRAHAVWALRRLGADSQLASIRSSESDAVVLAEFEGSV
ncbi:tRNA epoxyqueuosine(34) reductase QueG [Opitutaceae bacterium]|nr:tRNA epoxyqueuosine(34) reductase QueG [Opitutaceae bacterium]MDB4473852.1 tRNA epoxyqueuosine(34) reductase QueG [Opitutaceae bacterium]